MTLLCLASYEKGFDFLREAKRQGARVLLLTSLSLKDTVEWPRESLDDVFYMPDEQKQWNRADTLKAVAHLMRSTAIDRIVPLDDFDLEMAAFLREHFRLPGLGESQTRFFRDKLAMRVRARKHGLPVPEFVGVLNHRALADYMERVPPPWVLKPRLMAGAIGIKKVESRERFWELANALGDESSFYLLEKYTPGDVYHVDTIVSGGEVRFAVASRYGAPPMDVSQAGGIFTTQIVDRATPLERALLESNAAVMRAMDLRDGVSHTEFIVGRQDNEVYFLETSARVGGANIADLIEAASGVNPWREWAKIECATPERPYSLPETRNDYAGLLVTLARQEWPDTSHFAEPELCWRMNKKHHLGLIVRSPDAARVTQLLDLYVDRARRDYLAVLPPKERPTE